MKTLDFEGFRGSKIGKFHSRIGFERKKSSSRSKNVVAKGFREAFLMENGVIPALSPQGRVPGGGVEGMDKSIPDG